MYETRIIKPAEIIPRRGRGKWWGMIEWMGLIEIYCMYI
jgi:hypothetical protein